MTESRYQLATQLLELLRDAEAGRPLRLKEIEKRFDVQSHCAREYLDWVRDKVALVEERDGRIKVWRRAPEADPSPVAVPRAAALAFAAAALRELEGTEHLAELESMADQARLAVSEGARIRLERVTRTFQVRNAARSRLPDRANVVRELIQAIERRFTASFRYLKRNGDLRSYVVEPWGMVLYHGRLFLVAGRREPAVKAGTRRRMFDIDGIQSIAVDEHDRFPEPPGRQIDYHDAFRHSLGIFFDWPDPPADVHLRVRGPFAVDLQHRSVHDSQQISVAEDGWFDVRLRVYLCPDLVAFVLSMMPHVRVIEPAALRENVESAALAYLGVDRSVLDRSTP